MPAITLTWMLQRHSKAVIDWGLETTMIFRGVVTSGGNTSWSEDVTALTLVNETCTATVACKVVDDDVDGSTRYEYRIRVVKDDLTPADTPTVSSYWNNDTARTSAERVATN